MSEFNQVAEDSSGTSRSIRSDKGAQKRNRVARWAVLATILVAITGFGMLHQAGGSFRPVGVDALCPFGGVETLWSMLTGEGLLKRIAVSSVILMVSTLGLAFVYGRTFCGNLCALGAVQEFFGMIGKAIWPRKRPQMPAMLDRPARFLKYGVLVFFTIWTFQAADLVIRPYDPWVAWMHLTSAELFAEFGIGAAVLGISLAGSIMYERFFCKYLCPMGAFLVLPAKLSVFKIRRDENTCTSCGSCDKACPANIEVSTQAVITSGECLSCNECVNACPVSDTLTVATRGAAPTKMGAGAVLATTVGVFALIIALTSVAGAFAWTMPGLGGGEGAESHESGGTTGAVIDVENIRGYMSFKEVSDATGIPPQAFMERFGVTEADMTASMKDIASTYGFDVHTDVREWVSEQMAAGVGTGGTGEVPPPPH